MEISNDEYFALSRQLEQHHSLFYMMWEMGRPYLDKTIDTAAVRFDPSGELVQFLFNPDYWDALDDYNRLFIICHECLHVILRHGLRVRDTDDARRCNVALDIVVNHALVKNFGFDRNRLKDWQKYCWIDTVFEDTKVLDDKFFEHYYALIEPSKIIYLKLFDDHSLLDGNNWKPVFDKLNKGLSAEEKQAIQDFIEKNDQQGKKAGTESGGRLEFANVVTPPKKKKWETVIKQWSRKYDKPEYKDVEQWARLNRRYVMLDSDFLLPTEMETEHDALGKIEVWFFQDTSGSCANLKDRFFTAALTLDPKRFDVKMHCFDTQVFETNLESRKLYGFGGTAFQPIEDYIQKYILKNELEYPKAVFVLTDGFGSPVKMQLPERWYWFLSSSYKSFIPDECNIFSLANYE